MSFNIKEGLFKFDFEDHHAVLGVPLDADFNQIRKRYMQIARRLHPDSCKAESPSDKKLASQVLSKLANPAYSKLTNERSRAEHGVLLGMIGKRIIQEPDKVQLKSEPAQQLLKSKDLDKDYKNLVSQLSQKQYESLSHTLEAIGQISELNLVYVQRKQSQGQNVGKASSSKKPASSSAVEQKPPEKTTNEEAQEDTTASSTTTKSKIEDYCRRAQEFTETGNLTQAVVELKEGLKIEPKNSRAHGLLGKVYVKQNQTTLAKVHINQALKLNPKEEAALEAKKDLEKAAKKSASKKKESESPILAFLSNLFGEKKK